MNTPHARAQSQQWFWIAAIWSAVGLFDATQNVFVMRAEGMHHNWARLYLALSVAWLPWALATPLVIRLAHRYPPVQLKPLATWLRHLVACTTIGFVFSVWTATLERLLNPWAKVPGPGP